VGNDERGDLASKLLPHLIDSLLHFSLVGLVKRTGSFVKNQHGRLFNESASKGKSLFLATRELTTTGAHLCVDSFSVLANELPSIRLHERFLNFFFSRIRFSHKDVLSDRCVEENGLLANVSNLLTVVTQVNRF